ncbi:MAG: NAD(P)/FAD-dependent oxidoreductase, partial [Anaerolineales bacterium]|nr:NAD(P)/FAD-dependent oxidoreductase [Anaerolineales bacterium]
PDRHQVLLRDGKVAYDSLVLAVGADHYYHGRDEWRPFAPGLKSVEDALTIRQRILRAFEAAEREPDPQIRRDWMTFVVIGAGPTGVELAGAIAELAHSTLKGEFRHINPADVKIILLESHDRVLPPYPDRSSANARRSLEKLGVQVRTGARAEQIEAGSLRYLAADGSSQRMGTHTVLWAAGMRASPLAEVLHTRTGAPLDPLGRVTVNARLNLPGYEDIYVIGDMAHAAGPDGGPLPGVAPVAMQQGRYAAKLIAARLEGRSLPDFSYKDKGTLAVIGRNAAVAVFGRLQLAGFLAWFAWIFIHLWYLIEYDNKLLVLIQWAWTYFTRKRGARLITGETAWISPGAIAQEAPSFSLEGPRITSADRTIEIEQPVR